MSNRKMLLLSMLALLIFTASWLRADDAAPQAAPIPADAAVKESAVTGMRVAFYDFYPKDAAGIDSIDIAKNWIAGHAPTFVYKLNLAAINSPPGSELTVPVPAATTVMGPYLMGDDEYKKRKDAAAGDESKLPARLDAPIGTRAIFVYTGFIKVAKAGTYTISVPVDDGDETSIGGVVVHVRPHFGGINPDTTADENVGKMEFTAPGIYPIRVVHYDRDPGSLSIHVFSDLDPKGERAVNGKTLLPIIQSDK